MVGSCSTCCGSSPVGGSAVRVLYNPAAGSGRGDRAIVGIRAAFARFGFLDVRATGRAGDEARLVAEAIADGVETLVVVGGDGTFSNCAGPIAAAGAPLRLALIPAGTGNDFVKNLGLIQATPAERAHRLAERLAQDAVSERRVDMGRIGGHWFVNVAGIGFDVACNRLAERLRPLPGAPRYIAAAVAEAVRYRAVPLGFDGGAMRPHLLAVFSNGTHFGGAFHVAPGARIDDGRLDAVAFTDVPRWRRLPLLLSALRGGHLGHPACTHRRATAFRVMCETAPWIEVDGELRRAPGAAVEVVSVSGALRLIVD
ncbi:MAG: hypothetical protein RL625_683 [Gemmatimonadota bacterium]